MHPAISVNNLTKKYKEKSVVDALSFDIEQGSIMGLLGPNGAGKTTTLKMLTHLINKTAGEILINNLSLEAHPKQALQMVGASLDTPAFYNEFTALENLSYIAKLHENISTQKITQLLELVGLSAETTKKVRHYSLGMKQRLALARALIHEPKIVILDEPANGLDPQGMRKLYQLIRSLALEKQVTFIISSHQLSDMEELCTDVMILNKGKAILHGKTKELIQSTNDSIILSLEDSQKAFNWLHASPQIDLIDQHESDFHIQLKDICFDTFLKQLAASGLVIKRLSIKQKSLEDLFVELTEGWD